MKEFIRKLFWGSTEITEYSTITVEGAIREQVFFETGSFTINVSDAHWVLCLEPVVFGVWVKRHENVIISQETKCSLYFCSYKPKNEVRPGRDAVAVVTLEYLDKVEDPGGER